MRVCVTFRTMNARGLSIFLGILSVEICAVMLPLIECRAQGNTPPMSSVSEGSPSSPPAAASKIYKDSGWSPAPEKPKKGASSATETQGKRVSPIIVLAGWFCLIAAIRIFSDWRRKRIQARHVAEMQEYFQRGGR
jgi:hypothetical protein